MTDPNRPATGYPAPPQNGYPPPQQQSSYYYPNHNQQYYPPPPPPRAMFFRRIMSALISAFIIFGVILFIVWLVLRPRVPIFTVDSVSLSSLNLTTTNPSQISATWNAHLTVGNPNSKLHVYYDDIYARIFFENSLLAQNQLPPFDQSRRDQTAMTAELVASSAYIAPDAAKKFDRQRGEGSVKVDLQLLGEVWFKSGGWRVRRRYIRVFCDDLPISVSAKGGNGTLTGGSRRCAVVI